jgi:hypothetical protein
MVSAWIACTRPTTPLQFTWILGPILGGSIALGLRAVYRLTTSRVLVLLFVAAALAASLYAMRALARVVDGGEGVLPTRVMDIKDRIPRGLYRDVWFPAHAHARLGRLLCDAGVVSLHGHLAYVVDKGLGLDPLLVCGDRSRLMLVASDAPRHYVGMTHRFWSALGAPADCSIGSLGITARGIPLLVRGRIEVADGSTYLPRAISRSAPAQVTLSLAVPPAHAVLVTNVLGAYEYARVESAVADGTAVAAIADNDLSALFAPHAGSATGAWTITLAASSPETIDIVAVPVAPSSPDRLDEAIRRSCARVR